MNPFFSSRAIREIALTHDSDLRFRRGGAWAYSPGNARYASRHSGFLWNRHTDVGLRLVEEVQEEVDPPPRPTSPRRNLRGSSWFNGGALSPVPYRFNRWPYHSARDFGLRLVEEVNPPAKPDRGDRFNRGVRDLVQVEPLPMGALPIYDADPDVTAWVTGAYEEGEE